MIEGLPPKEIRGRWVYYVRKSGPPPYQWTTCGWEWIPEGLPLPDQLAGASPQHEQGIKRRKPGDESAP